MILCGNHGDDRFPVDKCQQARFFADHKFFNNNFFTGAPERVTGQHGVNRLHRVFIRLRNDNALTGRQTVRFDYIRRLHFIQKGNGFIGIGKTAVRRRRNVVTSEKIFGEHLGTFNARRRLCRAENENFPFCEHIDDTVG